MFFVEEGFRALRCIIAIDLLTRKETKDMVQLVCIIFSEEIYLLNFCPLLFLVLLEGRSSEEVSDLRTDFAAVGNWKKKDLDLGKGISESEDRRENGLVLQLSHLPSSPWRRGFSC